DVGLVGIRQEIRRIKIAAIEERVGEEVREDFVLLTEIVIDAGHVLAKVLFPRYLIKDLTVAGGMRKMRLQRNRSRIEGGWIDLIICILRFPYFVLAPSKEKHHNNDRSSTSQSGNAEYRDSR